MGTLASGSIDLKSLKVASGEATSYITKIDGGGIKVHDAGDMNNYIQLTSDGMSIYKNSEEPIAQYGEVVQVGKPSSSYLFIDNNGLSLKDKGLPIFQIRNESLDSSIDIETIRWGPQDSNGWNHTENQQYEAKTIEINFDVSAITEGQELNLSFGWSGNIYANNTDHRYTNQSYEYTFEYGTAETITYKKTITYSEAVFTVTYDGINLITIRSATNPVSPTTTNFVRVSKYYNIKVYTVDNISTIPITIIGAEQLSHAVIDYHSLQLINKEGDTYFHVSDLRDINGYLTDNFTGDGEENMFTFSVYGCDSVIKVTIDGVEQEQDTYYYFLDHITFNEAPGNNAEIIVIYTVDTTKCQALTFGNRKENQSIGIYSIAFGDNNSARGICSSAIGKNVTTGGDYSLAIGNSIGAMGRGTIATGIDAREQVQIGTSYNAQGAIVGGYISSLANSNSYITNGGKGSIVVGCIEDGGDMGSSSFGTAALGIGTWALGKGQTVIGTFNSLDTHGNTSNHPKNTDPAYTKYAFIIGNGYYDTTNDEEIRSNALTVDWNGNVTANKFISSNKVLWTGAWFMTDNQEATLSEVVTAQANGIILVWSAYSNDAAQNYDWNYMFVPKWHIQYHAGTGIDQIMHTGGSFCRKYVYVYDNKVKGHADNNATGTYSGSGIKYNNRLYVLRAILGV